jgi:hypothetical protein
LEAGTEHEVGVALDGIMEGWVTVDGRKVVQLCRLQWNFRGSQTIFVDSDSSLHCDDASSLAQLDGGGLGVVLG